MGKDDESAKGLTPQQHRQWALALWKRMDRDNNQEMTLDELNCSEFLEALRTILTPAMASKSVGIYARAEINLTQVLHHCLKLADTNRDGTLNFQEFERFLTNLRKPKHPTELALLYMNMFDADPDAYIAENEFRDMWRYFMGRNPRSDEFQFHWSRMDTARAGRISQRALAKWLAKTAPKAFTTLAPPVIEPEGSETEDPGSGSLQATRTKSKIFRPAPGLWHQPSTPWQSAHEWNSVPQDPCDQNIAWRGCQRQKTFFSRPESLPELRRFYATHRGFQAHKRQLKMPEEPPRRPVLSQESHQFMSQPGWERHEKSVLNVNGEVAAWTENTPRALQKQVREPGTMLLRVPLPPAPHLIHGRFPVWSSNKQ